MNKASNLTPLNPAQIDAMIRDYLAGTSGENVRKAYHISAIRFRQILADHGMATRARTGIGAATKHRRGRRLCRRCYIVLPAGSQDTHCAECAREMNLTTVQLARLLPPPERHSIC